MAARPVKVAVIWQLPSSYWHLMIVTLCVVVNPINVNVDQLLKYDIYEDKQLFSFLGRLEVMPV